MTMPTTHALDTSQGLVVFHIGMTIRKPHRPDLWAPVAAAMPRMLAELHRAKDAATAGPKAGKALGNQGEAAADSAGQTGSTPPSAQAPPPSTPAPKTPGAGPTAGPSQPEARPPKQPPPPAPKPTGKE